MWNLLPSGYSLLLPCSLVILKLLFTSKNETTNCSAICREKCNFGDRENRINDFCYGQSLKIKQCPPAVANTSTTAGFEPDRSHCCHCKNSKVLRLDLDAGQSLCGPGPERNSISPSCPWEWFITATVIWRDSGFISHLCSTGRNRFNYTAPSVWMQNLTWWRGKI